MKPGRKVLVGWEMGGGIGHLSRLSPIIQDLLDQGWKVVAAMRDRRAAELILKTLSERADIGNFELRGAPFLVRNGGKNPSQPQYSMAEALDWAGLGDPGAVGMVLRAWEHIVSEVEPDLVICDSAPSLGAAVRGRVPLLVIGNGWLVPPAGRRIPFLPFRGAEPLAAAQAEDRICQAFARATNGRHTKSLPDLLRGDTSFVCSPALLDPYLPWRSERLFWPPELDVTSLGDRSRTGPALIYLPASHPAHKSVFEAQGRLGGPTRAWLGGASPKANSNIIVEKAPIDFVQLLPSAPFVLHHGGRGTAAWALAFSTPQVILPTDLEKTLTAQAISLAGAGVMLLPHANAVDVSKAIERLPQISRAPIATLSLRDCDSALTRKSITNAVDTMFDATGA
jgi:hypothetical protein